MKIAIVHDALIEYGGGEKVLEVLASMFPQADIYSSVFSQSVLTGKLKIDFRRIKTSFLQSRLLVKKPKLIQLLSPLIWLSFDLKKYDLVISHGGFYCSNLLALKLKKT